MDEMQYRIITEAIYGETEAKRSRFLTALMPVTSEKEARDFLDEVRRQHRDAGHHCFAYRIGAPKDVLERFSDDGEPQGTAGKPMLELLRGGGLYDVCAVVTRYFGGTLLGTGGLVRAYADAMKAALKKAEPKELHTGIRVSVKLDYGLSTKLRYLAGAMGLYTESEAYAEDCTFTYLMPEPLYQDFLNKTTELTAGRALIEARGSLLYYETDTKKTKVYRELPSDRRIE